MFSSLTDFVLYKDNVMFNSDSDTSKFYKTWTLHVFYAANRI